MSAPLPVVGGSEGVWGALLNTYSTDLKNRVAALGGGTVTLPLPTPGGSADQWGTMLNAFLTDTEGRVTTVEGGGGGSSGTLPNSVILGHSTTMWADIMAAYEDAATVGGIFPTIYMPDEEIAQHTVLNVQKPIRILGAGPDSKLTITDPSIGVGGSACQVNIGAQNVELGNFGLKHVRASVVRTLGVSINWSSGNLNLHHLRFEDITSDCFTIRPGLNSLDPPRGLTNCLIYECTADEWYESFVLVREGDVTNVLVFNNTGTCTARHPDSSISSPYGIMVSQEANWGHVNNFVAANNTLSLVGVAGNVSNPSFGIGTNFSEGDPSNLLRYDQVIFHKNTISGFFTDLHFANINRKLDGHSSVVFSSNHLSGGTGPYEVQIVPVDGLPSDRLIVVDNDIYTSAGQGSINVDTSGSGAGGPTINFGANVHDGNNRHVHNPATITESFNTSDSSTLGPTLTWSELSGNINVVSNQARTAVNDTECLARAQSDLVTLDHYAQATVDSSNDTNGYVGLILRKDSSATETYYRCRIATTENTIEIHRVNAGTPTLIASSGYTHVAGVPVVLRFQAIGTVLVNLKVDLGGIPWIDINDPGLSIQAGTRVGLYGSKGTSGYVSWDSFSAGDLP